MGERATKSVWRYDIKEMHIIYLIGSFAYHSEYFPEDISIDGAHNPPSPMRSFYDRVL